MREQRNPEPSEDLNTSRILSVGDGLGVAEVGTVCLVVWRGPVVSEPFKRQRNAVDDIVQRYPRRAGFVCVAEQAAKPPDDKLRKASIEMVTSKANGLACVACVIEGSGFRAAANRSVLSGMALLVSKDIAAIKFVATVADAAPWVVKHCDGVSVASLLRTHAMVCLELDRA
jgi:hypothetical protein